MYCLGKECRGSRHQTKDSDSFLNYFLPQIYVTATSPWERQLKAFKGPLA